MKICWIILLLWPQIARSQIQSVLAYPGNDRYLGFTKWQNGHLILNEKTNMPAKISYDLMSGQIHCQLEGQSDTLLTWPDKFEVEGETFICYPTQKICQSCKTYYQVIQDGPTKLLRAYRAWWLNIPSTAKATDALPHRYGRLYIGRLRRWSEWYIQEANQKPHFILLTKDSLLRALGHKDAALKSLPDTNVLSEEMVRQILLSYNSELTRVTP